MVDRSFCGNWHLFCASLCAMAATQGGERVLPLDLTRGTAGAKPVTIRTVEQGVVEWTLANGAPQSMTLDLAALGIEPRDYDEIRVDIKPLVSQVAMETVLVGHLDPGEKSSWYLKQLTETGGWTEVRYDLDLDDAGVFMPVDEHDTRRAVTLTMSPRLLGYPGEPKERQTLLRNFRLVRHVVSADFDQLETEMADDAGEVACVYKVRLKNRTDQPQKVMVDLDSGRTLKYFRVEGPGPRPTSSPSIWMTNARWRSRPPTRPRRCIPIRSCCGPWRSWKMRSLSLAIARQAGLARLTAFNMAGAW